MRMNGIHHVTAIASAPQANADFYAGLLGLRLVKRTVNYDDPSTWHLYYGDGVGTPGTIMTFFAWTGLPPMADGRGRRGAGQIDRVSFRIPATSLQYWQDRLAAQAVDFGGPTTVFGAAVLTLADPDGIVVELVAAGGAGAARPWQEGPVPAEHAIKGIAGVGVVVNDVAPTAGLLVETMGLEAAGVESNRHRFLAGGEYLDLLAEPESRPGTMGIGVTHHVAWRAADRAEQDTWRQRLVAAGYAPTPVQDRNYFESIYYRDPAGVVFEVATDGPGFTVDETEAELGSGLRLPRWLEPRRERIAARLPDFTVGDYRSLMRV